MINANFALAVVILFLVAGCATSPEFVGNQESSPSEEKIVNWIVHTFFTQTNFPSPELYYTGEMTRFVATPPMGAYLPAGFVAQVEALKQNSTSQVFRVSYHKIPRPNDYYAYLAKEADGWKLTAVRTLTIPGFVHHLRDQLNNSAQRTSKENWDLENLNLLLCTDHDLKTYARKNLPKLVKIVEGALAGEPIELQSPQLADLHLSKVEKWNDGSVNLTIGGILDNNAGFLFVPKTSLPPPMSAGEFILVDPILEGWYLIKTT